MADKEINPKDPQAGQATAKDERDQEQRKSQAFKARRMSGRKSSLMRFR